MATMATKKKQQTLTLESQQRQESGIEILIATIIEELRGLRADFKSYVEKAGKHLTGGY